MQEYDRTSKWLIEHHGDSILRLAGVDDLVSWRPLQAELVQPRQLPDGLIEALRVGRSEPDLFVLELATYPDARVIRQALRDAALVLLDRDRLPEVLVLVLHPKGRLQVADFAGMESPRGWTTLKLTWRVVELWTIPAEVLLASNDPGIIPWVPLSRIDGPVEPILRECRMRIDRQAEEHERDNLLAVIQVLIGLRYDDPRFFAIFGGEGGMIESPVLRRFVAKRVHNMIFTVLQARFGPVPEDVAEAVRAITDDVTLRQATTLAAVCPDLATFRAELPPEPAEPLTWDGVS